MGYRSRGASPILIDVKAPEIEALAQIPLDIPTFDGNPSLGHLDVLFIPEGWNGFRYWMAFTPFPDRNREDPSIVCSNDGVNWRVPAGLTNPIATQAETQQKLGFIFNADCDLLMLDDGRLACYYRPAKDPPASPQVDAVYRKTSYDGVNWSEPELVLGGGSSDSARVRSPALVRNSDGTVSMFVTATVDGNLEVHRYDSPDGLNNWSGPTVCTVPAGIPVWHLDVVRVGDQYHMLAARELPYRLYYWTSNDGETFTGSTETLPLTGYPYDARGHYRSTLVPIPGEPLAFSLWLTGIAMDGTQAFNSTWRAIHIKRWDPKTRELFSDVPRKSEQSIWIPASMFSAAAGNAVEATVENRYKVWKIPGTELNGIGSTIVLPNYWQRSGSSPSINVTLFYTQSEEDSPSGDIVFDTLSGQTPLQTSLALGTASSPVTVEAPPRRILRAVKLIENKTVVTSRLFNILIRRRGNDADDTFDANVDVLGILIEPHIS